MITIIAPHARPEFSENLLANFQRQRGVDCRMLVVFNGKAERQIHITMPTRCFAITSAPHQADAMNAGLEWLRKNGGGNWARFDDDDYYGPAYLAGVQRSMSDGVVVSGMPWRFVMLDDGLHQFQRKGEFTGGSLACTTADVEQFPRVSADDLEWCKAMQARGAKFVEREPFGYCYDRRTRNEPRVIFGGSIITRRAFGPSLFYGEQPFSAVDDRDIARLSPVELPIPTDAEVLAVV